MSRSKVIRWGAVVMMNDVRRERKKNEWVCRSNEGNCLLLFVKRSERGGGARSRSSKLIGRQEAAIAFKVYGESR